MEHTLTNLHLWFSQEHTPKGRGRGKAASKTETAAGRQDKYSDNNKVKSQKMDEVGKTVSGGSSATLDTVSREGINITILFTDIHVIIYS